MSETSVDWLFVEIIAILCWKFHTSLKSGREIHIWSLFWSLWWVKCPELLSNKGDVRLTTRILYKVPLAIVQKPSDIKYSSALVYALHSLCYLFMFQEESKIIPVYFSLLGCMIVSFSGQKGRLHRLDGKDWQLKWGLLTCFTLNVWWVFSVAILPSKPENVDSYLDVFKLLLSGLLTPPGALTTTSGCQRTSKSIQFQTRADHFPALLPGM